MKIKSLEKIKISQKISISPEFSNKLKKKIYEYMDNKLLKWDNKIKGLLLNFSNLKLSKSYVEYNSDVTMHVPIIYDAIYFIPREGEKFYGEISSITDDKINFHIFNAVLGVIFLNTLQFKFNISTLDETDKIIYLNYNNTNYKLEVGSPIKIEITNVYFHLDGGIFITSNLLL